MITRAQAEALLTLAESLEACERIGITVPQRVGYAQIELPGDLIYMESLSGEEIREAVSDRMAKPTGS